MNKTAVKRLSIALLISIIFSIGFANIIVYLYSIIKEYVIR